MYLKIFFNVLCIFRTGCKTQNGYSIFHNNNNNINNNFIMLFTLIHLLLKPKKPQAGHVTIHIASI